MLVVRVWCSDDDGVWFELYEACVYIIMYANDYQMQFY